MNNSDEIENRIAQLEQMKNNAEIENPTITQLIEQGNKMLADEKKSPVATSMDNPFFRARIQILAKYPAWRKSEIERMERDNNKDNRYYDEFVREVAALGDTLKV